MAKSKHSPQHRGGATLRLVAAASQSEGDGQDIDEDGSALCLTRCSRESASVCLRMGKNSKIFIKNEILS